jgi:two-component system, sensor histidine kinase
MNTKDSIKILLVDNDLVSQRISVYQLSKLGYECKAVSSGEEAIQELEKQTYDLILMDVLMPNMDGIVTTQVIRQREGSKKYTIIVGLTSQSKDICIDAVMDDYVQKPATLNQLKTVLDKWIKSDDE